MRNKEKRKISHKNHLDPYTSGAQATSAYLGEYKKFDYALLSKAIKDMEKIHREQEKQQAWQIVQKLYQAGAMTKDGFISDAKNIGIDNFEIIQVIRNKRKNAT